MALFVKEKIPSIVCRLTLSLCPQLFHPNIHVEPPKVNENIHLAETDCP